MIDEVPTAAGTSCPGRIQQDVSVTSHTCGSCSTYLGSHWPMAVPGLVARGVGRRHPQPRVTEAASGPAAGQEWACCIRAPPRLAGTHSFRLSAVIDPVPGCLPHQNYQVRELCSIRQSREARERVQGSKSSSSVAQTGREQGSKEASSTRFLPPSPQSRGSLGHHDANNGQQARNVASATAPLTRGICLEHKYRNSLQLGGAGCRQCGLI